MCLLIFFICHIGSWRLRFVYILYASMRNLIIVRWVIEVTTFGCLECDHIILSMMNLNRVSRRYDTWHRRKSFSSELGLILDSMALLHFSIDILFEAHKWYHWLGICNPSLAAMVILPLLHDLISKSIVSLLFEYLLFHEVSLSDHRCIEWPLSYLSLWL